MESHQIGSARQFGPRSELSDIAHQWMSTREIAQAQMPSSRCVSVGADGMEPLEAQSVQDSVLSRFGLEDSAWGVPGQR